MAKKTAPEFTDENWTEYVLSNLRPSEKIEDENGIYPRAVGLLRVCQDLYGNVVSNDISYVYGPTPDNERATVCCSVVVERHADGKVVKMDDVADADAESLGVNFKPHLSPTASTRAMGRALKKVMFLNCYTSEEIKLQKLEGANVPTKGSNIKTQIIENLIKKHKLSKVKLSTKFKIKNWDKVEPSVQEELIEYLNEVDLKK